MVLACGGGGSTHSVHCSTLCMSGCGLAHSITQPDQTTAERRRLDKERIIMIGVHRHRVGESGSKEKKDVRTGKEKKKRKKKREV